MFPFPRVFFLLILSVSEENAEPRRENMADHYARSGQSI